VTYWFGNQWSSPEKRRGKGKDISSVLLQLSKQGYLKQGAWKNVAPPRGDYAEAWAVKCMLELCEYVCTEDEKASMAGNNSLEEEELVLLASSIEKKALMKMWDFECKNGTLEYDEKNKKKGGQSKKPTYLAIGVRVKKYKQRLAKRCGMTDYNQEKLCECPSDLR